MGRGPQKEGAPVGGKPCSPIGRAVRGRTESCERGVARRLGKGDKRTVPNGSGLVNPLYHWHYAASVGDDVYTFSCKIYATGKL